MRKNVLFAVLLASMFALHASADFALDQQEIVSQDGVVITIEGASDGDWAPTIETSVENQTDKDITVMVENASINGYMIDPLCSFNVAAGEKVTDTMEFWDAHFDDTGITDIASVKLQFHVVSSDDWDTLFDTDLITLQVPGMENYEQAYDDSGVLLYEDDNAKIVAKTLSEYYGDADVILYIENKSDQSYTVQARDEYVNGIEIESIMSTDITPGDHAISAMSFAGSDLEENGLTFDDITKVEFTLLAYDENYDDIFQTEVLSISYE